MKLKLMFVTHKEDHTMPSGCYNFHNAAISSDPLVLCIYHRWQLLQGFPSMHCFRYFTCDNWCFKKGLTLLFKKLSVDYFNCWGA